eukprot:CAMPEP_0117546334 /NCGR_PEP_ID=MMETSP0784-20121206/46553_1 /TAXON_ID=39447 /ORGANISM="" /LENGTH=443 /DNA_ID=CAMNT_0005343201 /DNA_START=344 /DNA_END=1679 /DNA_ORIENTATION=-
MNGVAGKGGCGASRADGDVDRKAGDVCRWGGGDFCLPAASAPDSCEFPGGRPQLATASSSTITSCIGLCKGLQSGTGSVDDWTGEAVNFYGGFSQPLWKALHLAQASRPMSVLNGPARTSTNPLGLPPTLGPTPSPLRRRRPSPASYGSKAKRAQPNAPGAVDPLVRAVEGVDLVGAVRVDLEDRRVIRSVAEQRDEPHVVLRLLILSVLVQINSRRALEKTVATRGVAALAQLAMVENGVHGLHLAAMPPTHPTICLRLRRRRAATAGVAQLATKPAVALCCRWPKTLGHWTSIWTGPHPQKVEHMLHAGVRLEVVRAKYAVLRPQYTTPSDWFHSAGQPLARPLANSGMTAGGCSSKSLAPLADATEGSSLCFAVASVDDGQLSDCMTWPELHLSQPPEQGARRFWCAISAASAGQSAGPPSPRWRALALVGQAPAAPVSV